LTAAHIRRLSQQATTDLGLPWPLALSAPSSLRLRCLDECWRADQHHHDDQFENTLTDRMEHISVPG
jgi:hypothetical protein